MEWLAAFRHPSMLALLVVPAALLVERFKREYAEAKARICGA